jgi:hypothetical protein
MTASEITDAVLEAIATGTAPVIPTSGGDDDDAERAEPVRAQGRLGRGRSFLQVHAASTEPVPLRTVPNE